MKRLFQMTLSKKKLTENNKSPFLDRDDEDGKILTTSWLAMMMIPAIRSDVGEGEEQSRKKGRRKRKRKERGTGRENHIKKATVVER